MRQTLCPRCDNILDKNGHCSLCDYQVKVLCHHCGHYNIPKAKYCGGCGIGTTLSVRYRRKLNNLLSPFQQIKVKRFFAGIAFGTLLTLFAFSSMGMKYNVSDTDNETISETNDFIIPVLKRMLNATAGEFKPYDMVSSLLSYSRRFPRCRPF